MEEKKKPADLYYFLRLYFLIHKSKQIFFIAFYFFCVFVYFFSDFLLFAIFSATRGDFIFICCIFDKQTFLGIF